MVERFPRNKSTSLYAASSRADGVLDGSATIRWGGIAWPGIQSFRNTRGKVEMAVQRPPIQSSGACHSAVWDCRPWGGGGKVRLPQRPQVSSKQATPLPLPNRFRQPFNYPRSSAPLSRISAWTTWTLILSFQVPNKHPDQKQPASIIWQPQKISNTFRNILHTSLPCCYWLWCHHP